MLRSSLFALCTAFFLTACQAPDEKETPLSYPETRTVEQVDDYFGTAVSDPYRWLEDDNSDETKAWVTSQNEVTRAYLDRIPYRQQMTDRLSELYNYQRISSPSKEGEYLFYRKNDGLQNQSVYYYQKGLDGEAKVFLDPNSLSEDGTTSVSLMGFSDNEQYVVVQITKAGSDWKTFKVMDVESREELEDELNWIKFSGANWYGNGFFYSRYPEPEAGTELSAGNRMHSVYFHELGKPQSEDELIFEDESNPLYNHYSWVTEDEKYLMLMKSAGSGKTETWFTELADGQWNFQPLFTGFQNRSYVIEHRDGNFICQTDVDAPNRRIVSIDPNAPQMENWTEIIPEKEMAIEDASTAGDYIFITYLEDAQSKVYRYKLDGSGEMEIQLPAPGTAGGFYGAADDEILFYYFTSFTYPSEVYKLDIASGESELFYRPELAFNPDEYETKQIKYKSKDGTEVPMFITHKKGIEMNGDNPTLLYSYGGFNISIQPSFSSSRLALMEQGVVYAVANLRGGGEYGEEWHQGGMLENKQNVFDDYIAAAEYLIAEGYTSPDKLAIEGRSNGGLLVGAVLNQRPDLYRVAFPAVGVMDMLRFHRFTIGKAWVSEYGCADSSAEQFNYLYAYSPLHNISEGTDYPATMVMTADHDDRVVPAHSFKYAATLQKAHSGSDPVIIRIETEAGHGGGTPIAKTIESRSDMWSFMLWEMGIKELNE